MRVFELNDCDAYCGRTLLQAVRASMKDSGCAWDEVLDRKRWREIPRAEWGKMELRDLVDEANPGVITLEAIMANVSAPQCVYSTEY